MEIDQLYSAIGRGGLVFFVLMIYIVINLRKVVPTNEVHILQNKKSTHVYGVGRDGLQTKGNVYLNFPGWVPIWGVSVTKLPLSIFDIKLQDYKAYDTGKVPFVVDITAFFVIKDPGTAAQKISNLDELAEQLSETLKGAVRKILAGSDILQIMEGRSEMGDSFYEEVLRQVKNWGVEVKSIEFMDIRDVDDSKVIENIMKKKKAAIESEAREQVALRNKEAQIAEDNAKKEADVNMILNKRETDLKDVESQRIVEQQEVDKQRFIALQKEEAKQKVLESQKITKSNELAIRQLEEEKQAEINKSKEIIKSLEIKEKTIISAQAEKEKITLEAEAHKLAVELEAKAEQNRIESVGIAKARETDYMGTALAKNKMEMAKALNQFTNIALAFMAKELEIGLLEKVDLEKAKALSNADVKVISTGANGGNGIEKFMDLFSAKGGTNLGAMIESFKDTIGEKSFNKIFNDEKLNQLDNINNKKTKPNNSGKVEEKETIKDVESKN